MDVQAFDAVPVERRDRIQSALSQACGAHAITSVEPLTGGASGALIYRVDASSRVYLLRVETRRDALRNPHQYVCMRTAAEADIAPPLRYLDEAEGIALMDCVPQQRLADYPGGQLALVRDLGSLIARLQATPRFPELRDYPLVLDRLLAFVRGSGVFAPGMLDPHAEAFQRIHEAYAWDAASLVSSHNDPNPRNILFDGQRLWLVDWETAYRNDPLTDVAIVIDNLAPTPDLEEALLLAWHGSPPDGGLRARLLVMRQLTRLYYAAIIMAISSKGRQGAGPDTDLTAPTPAEFGASVASGRLKPGAPDTLYVLGKMFLAGFLGGTSTSAFEDALAIVRRG
jgi:aminoglycoside phosphotransferase (APT) family kinase protein